MGAINFNNINIDGTHDARTALDGIRSATSYSTNPCVPWILGLGLGPGPGLLDRAGPGPDQVPGTIWYLARSGTWHDLARPGKSGTWHDLTDLVPGTIRSGTWHDN
jgi:hypothetical protein